MADTIVGTESIADTNADQVKAPQTGPVERSNSSLRRKITPKRKRSPNQFSPTRADLEACRKRHKRLNRRPYYEVSAIIAQKVGIMGDRWYKIRWAGYGSEEDSWVQPEDLNCPDKLEEFIETRQNQTIFDH